MKINLSNSINNTNFSGIYAVQDLQASQKYVAKKILQQLCSKDLNGVSYVNKIKNLGYDILITKPELYNPDAVRLCIIQDMKNHRLSDGSYDYLDAKIIQEDVYSNFSPQVFFEKVKQKIIPSSFKLNNIFKFFNR